MGDVGFENSAKALFEQLVPESPVDHVRQQLAQGGCVALIPCIILAAEEAHAYLRVPET